MMEPTSVPKTFVNLDMELTSASTSILNLNIELNSASKPFLNLEMELNSASKSIFSDFGQHISQQPHSQLSQSTYNLLAAVV